MYSKTVTFTDLNGVSRTETYEFNMTKAELIMMDYAQNGGMKAMFKKIIESPNPREIITAFEDILRRSYGVRSEDGRRFIKNDQLFEEFKQTEAYSMIFMELISDPGKAAEFARSIMPKDMALSIPADPEMLKAMAEKELGISAASETNA